VAESANEQSGESDASTAVRARPRVAVVGGGILGMTAAYRLAQAGAEVSLFERAPDLGGLVGSFDFDGTRVDRFYHVILPADDRVLGLAEELGLRDTFRFRPTRVGFYDDGRLFSMTSPKDFLTFPLLSLKERVQLALFVVRCQLTRSHDKLDRTPLLDWLRKTCGRRVTERLWEPLLDSKFDGRYDDLPATYIWARTRRMGSTRDRSGREVMGWLPGGYQKLIDAVESRIVELGGSVHPATAVEQIAGTAEGATGIVVDGTFQPFDFVLCTLAPPQARSLLAPELAERAPEDHCRYLGVVCLLLRVSRNVSPYYHLNITDRRVPLTTIVETTHVVDPEAVGGHLLYVSKYVDASHPDQQRPLDEVERDYLGYARQIFPDLRDDEILASIVQRARLTEPVHLLGGASRLPEMFPVPRLALASTAHVYPEIVSGQAVTGVTARVVPGILERLGLAQPAS
jgi:protoporphyrinogen oxidase